MPETKQLSVKNLSLDLRNFRTVPQSSEAKSIHALVSVKSDWFWSLMNSILENGYLPTENIIVLKQGSEYVVKEGNRRIASLKMILGELDLKKLKLDPPDGLVKRLADLPPAWRLDNEKVPCAIFEESEAKKVDRIVSLTHGKAEQAGRSDWTAVARARHNRDAEGGNEHPLDLLEAYLRHGKNRTPEQAEKWAGEYPLTVLEEAMKRLAPRLELANAPELAAAYPKIKHLAAFENIIRDIGLNQIKFDDVRKGDFAVAYGVPAPVATTAQAGSNSQGGSSTGSTSSGGATTGSTSGGTSSTTGKAGAKKQRAVASDEPGSVMRRLRSFKPKGKGRDKVALLLKEMLSLKIPKHPHSFCFLLRSIFEISAKAYCEDHKGKPDAPTATKAGEDRKLAEILRDITKYMTMPAGKLDRQIVKELHGAMAELGHASGLLSVTSMNQLIHNPSFVMGEGHICRLFANIFPLLEMMNS